MTEDFTRIGISDIIRSNRHLVEVGRATPEEIDALSDDFEPTGGVMGRIHDFHLVAIRNRSAGETTLHVLGVLGANTWITSDIEKLAPQGTYVKTRNSAYELRSRGIGPPSIAAVLTVARALRTWGFNRRYGLQIVDDADLGGVRDA
jgi:hypothetical protein